MALLTLLRHGQSTYNLQNIFTGNVDIPLTPFGEQEALMAGQKLKDFHCDIAYTSMLVRAWETLRIVLVEIKQPQIPIIENAALNERMYGNTYITSFLSNFTDSRVKKRKNFTRKNENRAIYQIMESFDRLQ